VHYLPAAYSVVVGDISDSRLATISSKGAVSLHMTAAEAVALVEEVVRRRMVHEALLAEVPTIEQFLYDRRHHDSNPRLCTSISNILNAIRVAGG